MTTLTLILSGLLFGIFLTLFIIRKMMKNPKTRIWLSNQANWGNNPLPDNCHPLIRHGKWIASHTNATDPEET